MPSDSSWSDAVLNQLHSLQEKQLLCDVNLISRDGTSVRVHSSILAAVSPVVLREFSEMGPHPYHKVLDCSSAALCSLVSIIYTGTAHRFDTSATQEEVTELLKNLEVPFWSVENLPNWSGDAGHVVGDLKDQDAIYIVNCPEEGADSSSRVIFIPPGNKDEKFGNSGSNEPEDAGECPAGDVEDSHGGCDGIAICSVCGVALETELALYEHEIADHGKSPIKTRPKTPVDVDNGASKTNYGESDSDPGVERSELSERLHQVGDTFSSVPCEEVEGMPLQDTEREKQTLKKNKPQSERLKMICAVCKEDFPTAAALMKHAWNVHKEKTCFQCESCPKTFTKAHSLRDHVAGHKGNSIACTMCQKMMGSSLALKRHIDAVHLKLKPFICSICGRAFSKKAHMQYHEKLHRRDSKSKPPAETEMAPQEAVEVARAMSPTIKSEGNKDQVRKKRNRRKPMLCTLCGKVLHSATTYAHHIKFQHENIRPFKCSYCDKTFTKKYRCEEHENLHTGAQPYSCSICGKAFKQKESLHKHEVVHKQGKPVREKKHGCSFCGQKFHTPFAKIIHERTHTGERPFVCKYCSKGFPSKSDLTIHIRRHEGEKPCVCPCGKAFASSAALQAHSRTHTGEKPYQCKHCNAAYTQSHKLTAHMKAKHPQHLDVESPFKCSECPSAFTTAARLRMHISSKHSTLTTGGEGLQLVKFKEEREDHALTKDEQTFICKTDADTKEVQLMYQTPPADIVYELGEGELAAQNVILLDMKEDVKEEDLKVNVNSPYTSVLDLGAENPGVQYVVYVEQDNVGAVSQ